MKKLITRIRNLRWKLILASLVLMLVLLIVVPLLINEIYKTDRIIYTTMWDAADVLAYYGTVLASAGAAVGVWFSVRAANKNYQDDVRARVLPFIAVTPFEQKAVVDTMALLKEKVENHKKAEDSANTPAVQYEEYKLSRIYFVITKRGIDTMKKLSKTQQTLLEHAGTMWVSQAGGGKTLQRTEFYSMPLEIENVGNGTAANLRIGFNRKGESECRFVRPMMLKQGQTLYIHIFSTESYDVVKGIYLLDFYYEDIYGNEYHQQFPVNYDKNQEGEEVQSITLVGKQTRIVAKSE